MFCPNCGDKVDPGEIYCDKCGIFLGEANKISQENNVNVNTNVDINVNTNTTQNVNTEIPKINHKKENLKIILIGGGFGTVVVAVICLIVIALSSLRGDYYFSEVPHSNPTKEETVTTSSTDSGSSNKKGKYSTSVVTTNTYTNVKINNANDAYDLIRKDSVEQKGADYPQEILDVENNIISNYDITAVNLKEMDPEFARELGNVIRDIYEEYPTVRGYITNMSLVNTSMSDKYIAAFMPIFSFASSDSSDGYPEVIKTQVLLSAAYFLNPDRLDASVKDGSNSGHFPANATIYSPVAHELGHYLSFLAMMNHYKLDSILLIDKDNLSQYYKIINDFRYGEFSLYMITEAYENYKKEVGTDLSLDEWRGTISNYAVTKDNDGEYIYDETISESFHDVYLNKENAADASKYVVKVLKKYLEE